MSGIQIKLKIQNIFETPLFASTVKEYFQNIFPKIFEKYNTTPAKGGTTFEKYSDMSYPMHILNGILPAMLYLEQKLLENEYTSELVKKEDPDIKMLISCALVGITLHDINKMVGKSNLIESLEYLNEVLNELELALSDEEKNIVKYLIVGAEDGTRYTIPDIELPKRRNLDRFIKDFLIGPLHLADKIASPPEELESLSQLFRKLQKDLKEYLPNIHSFYFHDSPYEVLSRYLLTKLISRIEGKILLISPKGFIWIGKPLTNKEIEILLDEFKNDFERLLLDNLDKTAILTWEKTQLDIFRFFEPTKEFIKNLIKDLLERNEYFLLEYRLPRDEMKKENIKREIEKLKEEDKIDVLILLRSIFNIKLEDKTARKIKNNLKKDWLSDTEGVKGKELKIIKATSKFLIEEKEKLYSEFVKMVKEEYKNSKIDINELFRTVLAYAYLDGNPIFGIKIQDVGDKQNICSICGAETNIVAKEGVAFGFTPRGFTNRTVVSLKNTERKICKACLAEVMLRKLIFGRSKDLYAVYIDACDYTIPILNAERVAEKVEEQINGIRVLSNDIFNSYRIFYGYSFKDSKNVLIPFLIAHIQAGKEADFLRRFYELLVFASNTGFKVYLTYTMNPDRIKRETFVLDYAPKPIKKLKWDKIRIDELQRVRNEFEILMNLAKAVGGRRWQNEFVRVLNDYATSPLAFFYYLYRLDNPFGFVNKNQDKIQLIYERIGGEIMGVIEKLADKASDIEWSGYTASKQTWIIRTAIDALKTGVQRKLDKEDTIALMAGVINKKVKFLKKDAIDDFCRTVYEDLYEKTWQKKIPSKTELRYWTYAFAFEYAKKSEEKRKKMKEEKQKEGGENDE